MKYDTTGQNSLVLYYPDDQRVSNFYVLGPTGSLGTSGGTAASTVTTQKVVPIKTSVAKLDNEVTSADRSNTNLILIGGPAVNTLVAELATAGKTKARADYGAKGVGYYIVDLVKDAFTTGKVALVVAGYEASETRTATALMQKYDDTANAALLAGKTRYESK